MAALNTGLAGEVAGAGIVVPPGDAHLLAAAMRALADDMTLRQKLGECARRRAVERWDRSGILQSYNPTILN
jgi:colanic acid biosynthesis glycosyl transferase WcaI